MRACALNCPAEAIKVQAGVGCASAILNGLMTGKDLLVAVVMIHLHNAVELQAFKGRKPAELFWGFLCVTNKQLLPLFKENIDLVLSDQLKNATFAERFMGYLIAFFECLIHRIRHKFIFCRGLHHLLPLFKSIYQPGLVPEDRRTTDFALRRFAGSLYLWMVSQVLHLTLSTLSSFMETTRWARTSLHFEHIDSTVLPTLVSSFTIFITLENSLDSMYLQLQNSLKMVFQIFEPLL